MAQRETVVAAGSANVVFNSPSSLADGQFLAAQLAQLYAAGVLKDTEVAGGPGKAPFQAASQTNLLTITGAPTSPLSLQSGNSAVVVTAPSEVDLYGTTGVVDLTGAIGFTVVAGIGGLVLADVVPTGANVTDYFVAGGGDNEFATRSEATLEILHGIDSQPAGTGNYNVVTGDGNDTIAIADGRATVQAGGGHNYIALGSTIDPTNDLVVSLGYDSIVGNTNLPGTTGAGGTDTIDVVAGQTTIMPGSANLFVTDSSPNPISVFTGSGSDTVYMLGAAKGTVQGGLAGNNLLVSNRDLTLSDLVLQGGGNGDKLAAVGAGQVTLLGGAGNEELNAALASGNVLLQAGTGNDTLVTSSQNPLQTGFNGYDTVRGAVGAGSTALILINSVPSIVRPVTLQFTLGAGGGSDTVAGLGYLVQFTGYGAAPLANANVSAAGTQVTLSDGTNILFAGTTSFAPGQVTAR